MIKSFPAAKLEQIPEDGGRFVSILGNPIALFRRGTEVFAIDDRCPHMGSSLSAGSVENGVVTCPWHGWRFRIDDGAWVSCPNNRNRVYPVDVKDGTVYVSMETE
ncbi:MAG TPA: Rieske (2Fe-2S) protein [Planctomycetia bacterium]|nr:Rieske (2Fe-2S) protein [Planctomycetia bacterium]